jgi:hypothetical protein
MKSTLALTITAAALAVSFAAPQSRAGTSASNKHSAPVSQTELHKLRPVTRYSIHPLLPAGNVKGRYESTARGRYPAVHYNIRSMTPEEMGSPQGQTVYSNSTPAVGYGPSSWSADR